MTTTSKSDKQFDPLRSLSHFYKDHISAHIIRDVLDVKFEEDFAKVIKLINEQEMNDMEKLAIKNKHTLKEMYIEYGMALASAGDLKQMLASIPNYMDAMEIAIDTCDRKEMSIPDGRSPITQPQTSD